MSSFPALVATALMVALTSGGAASPDHPRPVAGDTATAPATSANDVALADATRARAGRDYRVVRTDRGPASSGLIDTFLAPDGRSVAVRASREFPSAPAAVFVRRRDGHVSRRVPTGFESEHPRQVTDASLAPGRLLWVDTSSFDLSHDPWRLIAVDLAADGAGTPQVLTRARRAASGPPLVPGGVRPTVVGDRVFYNEVLPGSDGWSPALSSVRLDGTGRRVEFRGAFGTVTDDGFVVAQRRGESYRVRHVTVEGVRTRFDTRRDGCDGALDGLTVLPATDEVAVVERCPGGDSVVRVVGDHGVVSVRTPRTVGYLRPVGRFAWFSVARPRGGHDQYVLRRGAGRSLLRVGTGMLSGYAVTGGAIAQWTQFGPGESVKRITARF